MVATMSAEEEQMAHGNLATSTAREFMNNAQLLGMDPADVLCAMELILTIVVVSCGVIQRPDDLKRYCSETLDVMTERCVQQIGKIDIQIIKF